MRFLYRLACFNIIFFIYGKAQAQPSLSGNTFIVVTSDTLPSINPTTATETSQSFLIRSIIITGNKKTNPNIILRELSFQIDEIYTLDVISKRFQKARKQLMNSGLFLNVVVSMNGITGNEVAVNVQVEEKWYIWPQPFIRTVDRSFQEWWSEKNRSMDRINYGVRLTHNNFTGRNDKLKINVMNGYTKQLSLQYYGLYLDHKLRWSVNGGFAIGKNREVNYMTRFNKSVPIKNNNEYLRTYMSWFAEVSFRPAIKTKHTFGVAYANENFADTIFKLNPFFSSGNSRVRYPELTYKLSYFDVDFIPYPTRGYMGDISLKKKGFNDPLNLWQLTLRGAGTWGIGEKYFLNLRAVGRVKLPFDQPYITRQFIGNDEMFMQGYEYYVIDGVAGGYTKATIARPLLNTHIRIPNKRIKRLNSVPFKLYAKTFVDAGYVYSKYPGQNELTNKILYSCGVGLDMVIFADFVVKFEWSFNRLGENGLYLHKRDYF